MAGRLAAIAVLAGELAAGELVAGLHPRLVARLDTWLDMWLDTWLAAGRVKRARLALAR
jgi:hypothetical protein